MEYNELIYGIDRSQRVVSVEIEETQAVVFQELEDGRISKAVVPYKPYILFTEQHSPKFTRLSGDQPYRWLYEADSQTKYRDVLSSSYKKRFDLHNIRDQKEAFLVKTGVTYFKGMKAEDVSVLSFDLETTGLTHDADSRVLLISNTLRKNGKYIRKLFSLDDFKSQWDMLTAWCQWVIDSDPSIVLGHNIYSFDFPYLAYVASKCKAELLLGRNGSAIRFSDRTSQFRKDGSQAYDYVNAWIYGREIVDTYFLALKSDIARNYESYGLKQIIKQEGLERKGREHYDASQISKNWEKPEERVKIKKYAIDDADDALKLYDLMIPSLFYYTQSIPRSFQSIINTATGSQINSLMVRSYLQKGHSIAKGSDAVEYEGAISMGVPGIHKNVFKIDVASLYPSIMLQYNIHSKRKDPMSLSPKILRWFTSERLKNKSLAKETGDRYYKDLSESQKIVCNSWYGAMGAPKLNYNCPEGAAEVTRRGREILQEAFKWATGKEYNAA